MLTQQAGITISAYLHLPAAVEFEVGDLESLDDAVLIKLQLDCVEWRIAVEEQRDAIRRHQR